MNSIKQHIPVYVFALFLIISMVSCSSSNPVNIDADGLAIKGYDTVAYFIVGKPVKGDKQFSHIWKDATWLFTSREHLDLFVASPEKYAPQYGGY